MSNAGAEPVRKADWILTQSAFNRLLTWLDTDAASEGHSYIEIRRKLVTYFDRKNCPSPEELADETLNRVARRLEEEGTILNDTPVRYCYIVARFVLLESFRRQKRVESLDEESPILAETREDNADRDRRAECLDRCMQKLTPEDRQLIISYYQGEQRVKIENRRSMAAKLGLTTNALSIRACRIRDKLESCMQKSLNGSR